SLLDIDVFRPCQALIDAPLECDGFRVPVSIFRTLFRKRQERSIRGDNNPRYAIPLHAVFCRIPDNIFLKYAFLPFVTRAKSLREEQRENKDREGKYVTR